MSFNPEAFNPVAFDPQAFDFGVGPPTILTTSLPSGLLNVPYSQTLTASGSQPITWALDSGDLPDGLTLDTDTGEISGTPTELGTFAFTVEATNDEGSDTQELSISIVIGGAMPTIYLADDEPVPSSAVFIAGGAFAQDGHRYIAPLPEGDRTYAIAGLNYREDGALIVNPSGSVTYRVRGIGVTVDGEVVVDRAAPDVVQNEWPLLQDGTVCVTDIN